MTMIDPLNPNEIVQRAQAVQQALGIISASDTLDILLLLAGAAAIQCEFPLEGFLAAANRSYQNATRALSAQSELP